MSISTPLSYSQSSTESEYEIPILVKSNAGWWAEGAIDDVSFVQGVQYLIKEGIIQIPPTQVEGFGSNEIPAWVKNNVGWWAEGQISDDEFIGAIQFLVKESILVVSFEGNIDPIVINGMELLEAGHPKEAIKQYDKALEIDPNHVHAINIKKIILDRLDQ